MFEAKAIVFTGTVSQSVTLATFEGDGTQLGLARAKKAAVKFVKQIDKAFSVCVVEVANEDNAEANYGIVFEREGEYT